MARVRAIIDFDIGISGALETNIIKAQYIVNPINDMLHKLVTPENLEHNKILFATVTYEIKDNRFLFTQNDPEADDDS